MVKVMRRWIYRRSSWQFRRGRRRCTWRRRRARTAPRARREIETWPIRRRPVVEDGDRRRCQNLRRVKGKCPKCWEDTTLGATRWLLYWLPDQPVAKHLHGFPNFGKLSRAWKALWSVFLQRPTSGCLFLLSEGYGVCAQNQRNVVR